MFDQHLKFCLIMPIIINSPVKNDALRNTIRLLLDHAPAVLLRLAAGTLC